MERSLSRVGVFSTILCLATAGGCADRYIRISSTLHVNARQGTEAHVQTTAWFQHAHPRINAIAIEAPDQCFDRGTSDLTGVATPQDNLLHLRCAVEMSEIERALAAAGYAVHSWRALDDTARAREISAIQAARQLGAQVLIQVNSFSTISWNRAPVDIRWDRAIHESNVRGTRGRPVTLSGDNDNTGDFSAQDLLRFESLITSVETGAVQDVRRGVELDVTSISTESGRSVWFYRRAMVAPFRDGEEVIVLVKSGGDGWSALLPASEPAGEAGFFRQSRGVTRTSGNDNEDRAQMHEMMRTVASDCIQQFIASAGTPAAVDTGPAAVLDMPAPRVRPPVAESPAEPPPPPVPTVVVATPVVPATVAMPVPVVVPAQDLGDGEDHHHGRRRRRDNAR